MLVPDAVDVDELVLGGHAGRLGERHYPGQDGWEEVADFILGWTVEHSTQPRGALA